MLAPTMLTQGGVGQNLGKPSGVILEHSLRDRHMITGISIVRKVSAHPPKRINLSWKTLHIYLILRIVS